MHFNCSMDIGRPSDGATAARKKIAVRRRPLAATVAVREQAPPTGYANFSSIFPLLDNHHAILRDQRSLVPL